VKVGTSFFLNSVNELVNKKYSLYICIVLIKRVIIMIGKPKFKKAEWVKFEWRGEIIEGEIWQVDAYGTFFQTKEPSYDIFSPKKNMLYKHMEESCVTKIDYKP
jgi:DNA-directed RNA polymerase subunit E'/Rpb7